jgi:hypothetical protein
LKMKCAQGGGNMGFAERPSRRKQRSLKMCPPCLSVCVSLCATAATSSWPWTTRSSTADRSHYDSPRCTPHSHQTPANQNLEKQRESDT